MFGEQTREYWCDSLEGTDACFAPVLTYGEVHNHPHHQARNSYVELDGEWHPQPAPRFSETRAEPAWQEQPNEAPATWLRELGLADDRIIAAGL